LWLFQSDLIITNSRPQHANTATHCNHATARLPHGVSVDFVPAMVKPENDATLDYYALLNVTITASSDEIKKQYKKFGIVL